MSSLGLADIVAHTRRHLSQELMADACFARISALAERLPKVAPELGIEVDMTREDAGVDVTVCLAAGDPAVQSLAHHGARACKPPLSRRVAWERLANFCAVWNDPESVISDWLTDLWLEFDTGTPGPRAVEPCVFFTMRDLGAFPFAAATAAHWLTREALPRLTGAALSPALCSQIDRAIAARGVETRMVHVGVMLLRRTRGVRIYHTQSQLPALLEHIERVCPDRDAEVSAIAKQLSRSALVCPSASLQLEVTSVGVRRAWLELNVDSDRNDPSVVRRSVAQIFEALPVGSAAKRAEILGWFGHASVGGHVLVRSCNHVKMPLIPQRREMKVYLSVRRHEERA